MSSDTASVLLSLAGAALLILLSVCAYFLSGVHRDLKLLTEKFTALLIALPDEYLKKSEMNDFRRHHSEGMSRVHHRISIALGETGNGE